MDAELDHGLYFDKSDINKASRDVRICARAHVIMWLTLIYISTLEGSRDLRSACAHCPDCVRKPSWASLRMKDPWWEKPSQPSWPEDPCPLDSLQLKADTGVWPIKPIEPPAAAKSLQSCPTLCDPRDGSPPGFPIPWMEEFGGLQSTGRKESDKTSLSLFTFTC